MARRRGTETMWPYRSRAVERRARPLVLPDLALLPEKTPQDLGYVLLDGALRDRFEKGRQGRDAEIEHRREGDQASDTVRRDVPSGTYNREGTSP